jgi:hypothetical protein
VGRGSLRLGAPVPLGTTRGRTSRWSSRVGRAAGLKLEPAFLLRATICGCHDDDTSVARGGDDKDNPAMPLQPTAALATLPLHDGSGDDLHWRRRQAPPPSST